MKKRVAVIAGGDSGEYEISVNSARVVIANLLDSEFLPYLIIIRGKEWHYVDDQGKKFPITKEDFSLTIDGNKILENGKILF